MTQLSSRTPSAEPDVVVQTRNMIVRELKQWLPPDEKELIKLTPREHLFRFHHGLGTAIRNEYELWSPDHPIHQLWQQDGLSPESVYHPDSFSYSCIIALYEALQ